MDLRKSPSILNRWHRLLGTVSQFRLISTIKLETYIVFYYIYENFYKVIVFPIPENAGITIFYHSITYFTYF